MGLSRLENFLKSGRGTILYVDPNSLDSTDSIENSGNSLTRPFKTIQRALIESARFSYQRGQNNDRFNKTTIVLYPGDHLVDNRPGYIPTGSGLFSTRGGSTNLSDLTQWDLDTVFDLSSPDNTLYKLNSVHGGMIVPRGTSIVGMDLRKTKIRPLYVPNPNEIDGVNIERSCVFRTTGACYFWQFTILDADPNGVCYKDYTKSTFVPNFSHHKLAGFEYADGVNSVEIDDDFLTYSTSRTDLDMYYEKVARVYGPASGREIQPDYGDGVIDIQPVIDEYRIVGSKGGTVGITSIKAGDGFTSSNIITVKLVESIEGLSVDSPIQINGIGAEGYDGQYVVSTVISNTEFTYQVQNSPLNPLPPLSGSTMNLVVDTVTSASPYIFNISLRSVYGMCGLLADGDKATGFKSMVVAQYTGIGLQKDDNAFVKYDKDAGSYKDSRSVVNLHTDSLSRFKPSYENFHIKATNDAFLQLVSVFAIGYAQHFVTESGGDIALNNSNSNFGSKALVSTGFKRTAFTQDDFGYITHIVPPKEIESTDVSVEFYSIDVGLTTSVGISSHLYLYNETNLDAPPKVVIDGYHIGAKVEDELKVQVIQSGLSTSYSSKIVMPNNTNNSTLFSSEKLFTVKRSATGINSITSSSIINLTEPHSFIAGESIRIIADNGHLPDGLNPNQVYYAITSGIGTNQIKVAQTLSGAISNTPSPITINEKGGILRVVSRVSDKNAGDIGHPVQWDTIGNWYINVSPTNNEIYDTIDDLGVSGLGEATTRSYVTRTPDSRSLIDTLYRVRYVIPKDADKKARPPVDGFILQESNNIIGSGEDEISQLYNSLGSVSDPIVLRNPKFIADVSWSSNVVRITSEIPHELKTGDEVEIVNVSPDGYNGTYTVESVLNSLQFTYSLTSNPGSFANNTDARNEDLPYLRRKRYNKTYQVYRTQEIQSYVAGVQDGVYYLTLLNHANYPTVTPFREEGFSQPIENLYPQLNKDNPNSDPDSAESHALPNIIGKVVVNDPQYSVTKATLQSFAVGTGITNIRSSSGTAHTIYTNIDHGFSGITSVSIVSGGANYGSSASFNGSLYNAELVGFAGSTTGSNATAKIQVSAGIVTAITIINGGSAYGIGNTLRVVGVASTSSFSEAVVRIESVSDNIDDTLNIVGVSSVTYNTLYRVSGITTGKPKEFDVVSSESISGYSVSGLGSTATSSSGYVPTGKAVLVDYIECDTVTGITTVQFTESHGFRVDNKIRIGGANESEFNGDFIVKRLNDNLVSLVINVGPNASTQNPSGTVYAYRPFFTSYGGELIEDTESTSGRLNFEYGGITGSLVDTYFSNSNGDLNILNAVSLGFKLGDYLMIDNEIFRISSVVSSDSVSVLRAVLGTPRQTHLEGSVIRKIKVRPVELRRNSIIRASGHTFEYLGYGPGNYSTSLPENQSRALSSSEKFLAQATKTDGGIVVYTGMNSDGDFFAGNKKINSATGKEESFETPIPTVTGDKSNTTIVNLTDTQKIFASDSIKIEGGKDKNTVSEFGGPTIFNNKVTINSDIEANSLFVQGEEEVSRKFSISNEEPTESGNYGDVIFNSEPAKFDFIGWTYVTENQWEPFGFIGGNGVGISSGGTYVGFATLVNFRTTGINLATQYSSSTGIATVHFDANPRVAISTGGLNSIAGIVTQINFVGSAVSVIGSTAAGIATVNISVATSDGFGAPNLPFNSLQFNNSGSFGGVQLASYDTINNLVVFGGISTYYAGNLANAVIFDGNGYLGFSSAVPTSKIEIVADNEKALYIKSTQGAEIVRIDNSINDTTPFVIDQNGNVGINTRITLAPLDVLGNAAITGSVRLYESDRSNYVGLRAGSLSSDLIFTLPTSYGTSGQILSTNGNGTLSWKSDANQEVVAGTGITISYANVGSGITVATIRNAGITSVVAGNFIQISVSNGTATITGVPREPANLYPFTTRGFSMPL